MKKLVILVITLFVVVSCVQTPKPTNEVNENKVKANVKAGAVNRKKTTLKRNVGDAGINISDSAIQRVYSVEEKGKSKKFKQIQDKYITNVEQNKNSKKNREKFPLLNLEDASLWEVIKVISDYKGWNYIIDPSVPDKGINIRMNRQVSGQNIDSILHILLSIYDVSMVQRDGVVYFSKVKGSADTKIGSGILFGNAVSKQLTGEGWVTQVIPLHFASTKDIAGVLKDFMSPGSSYFVDDVSSIVVIIDRAPFIRRILEIVRLLDVDVFKNRKMALIKFENADASKVQESIATIFKGYPGLDETKYYLVALKEMNALLCISSVQEIIDEVKFWSKKYEKESEVGEVQVFVYRVEHSSADDLSAIIKDLYASDYKTSKSKDGKIMQKPVLQGELKIITDKTNNALIFKCTKRDYNIIEKTLKKLDIPKKQVLIEMKIIDLSMTDNFQYGFQWYLRQKAADRSRNQSFDFLSGSIAGTYNLLFDSKTLEGIFNAEETKDKSNVLSQPHILVLDNESATINIGDQISIQTGNISVPQGTTTTSGFYNSTSYQYLKTGINLSVKPSISSNGIVRLEIKQSHTIPGAAPATGGNPPIQTRDIQTVINVPDGKSVLLGGIITDSNSHTDSSTPILSKIPVLRYFFGGQNKSHSKKELIMIITPRVVYTPEEAINITEEFENRINEFKLRLYGELKNEN